MFIDEVSTIEKDKITQVNIKLAGDSKVLAQIISLLADIRYTLNTDTEQTYKVTVNAVKNSSPIIFSVNDKEIPSYKPQYNQHIN